MTFAEILFLLGAAGVIGPLLAHLLAKPRFKRIPFTMLRFLHSGQVESQSRRRFRDLLILLLRCAIIVLFAMLFAQPRLLTKPPDEKPRPIYYLGLDNSLSMGYTDSQGSYIEAQAAAAREYINSADDNGEFNICALATGQWSRGLTKPAALAEVGKIKTAPGIADFGEFITYAGSQAGKGKSKGDISIFVSSDFTAKALNQFSNIAEPTFVKNFEYKAIISSKPVNNAAVVEAQTGSYADNMLTLNVTVVNLGETDQSRKLTAVMGDVKSEPVEVVLGVNQRGTYPVQIEIKPVEGEESFLPIELTLSSGDGLKEDDTYYLGVSLPKQKSLNVLVMDEADETFLVRTAMSALSKTESYSTVRVKDVLYNSLTSSDIRWADVVICSCIRAELAGLTDQLESFVSAGGRLILFMNTAANNNAAKKLWKQGLLAAQPGNMVSKRSYILPRSQTGGTESLDAESAAQSAAIKALTTYRIDKIFLTGHFECKGHSESICPWRLDDGTGFVFFKRYGNGTTVLVNTSCDDTLGGLTKSKAAVAFCGYLLGQSTQIGRHSFSCDERVFLPASEMEMQYSDKEFWVKVCDDKKRRAVVSESLLVVENSGGIGWVKTMTKPIRYAGINPPPGETDMTRPAAAQLGNILSRAFAAEPKELTETAGVVSERDYKSIWKIFAWVLIGLLLLEPAIVNRLKR